MVSAGNVYIAMSGLDLRMNRDHAQLGWRDLRGIMSDSQQFVVVVGLCVMFGMVGLLHPFTKGST